MRFSTFPFTDDRTTATAGFRPGFTGQVQRAIAAASDVEPTPYEIVYTENKTTLRHYHPETDEIQPVPIVISYAFINTPAILDLEREHSVVGQFLERGFEVFLVDWGYPSRLDRALGLQDYVTRYLHNCVGVAMEIAETERVHLLGYSTGAPVAVMYASLYSERIQTLVLQGPPVDFHVDGGILDFRELHGAVDPAAVTDTLGNVPAWLVDAGFSVRKPVGFTIGTAIRAGELLNDDAAVQTAARKFRWLAGGPDMPAALFRDFVERLLVENQLIANELEIDGRTVDLGAIDSPILLILGTEDQYVPPESALPLLDAVASQDTAVMQFPTGHVGLSIADDAHLEGWPRVCDWLEEHSQPR